MEKAMAPHAQTERLHFHFSLSCIGEENGNSLQCSCLENPRDGGVWWAAIYGVPQSRTRLKRLSSSSRGTYINVTNLSSWSSTRVLLCSITQASETKVWFRSKGKFDKRLER